MSGPRIHVELAQVRDGRVRRDAFDVTSGATLEQALQRAAVLGLIDRDALARLAVGVFGVRRPPGHRLHPGDRIELTEGLTVDPKIARQRRVAKRRANLPRDKWSPDR